MSFKENTLKYILIPLLVMLIASSYVRFILLKDYSVAYEGVCDPAQFSCFIGCEDDECTQPYYYSNVVKYAPDLYEQCGIDITDCEKASVCLAEDDTNCKITYCDPTDGTQECYSYTETGNI
jgi:hypothetical protein